MGRPFESATDRMLRNSQERTTIIVMSLTFRASIGIAALAGIMAVAIFVVAGSLSYWQGWVYLVVFLGASIATTGFLVRHDPALLERRMRGGPFAEQRTSQVVIMSIASVAFIALIVVPVFDARFAYPLGWTRTPRLVEGIGLILIVLGFYGVFCVYRVNSFAAATIQIADDHRVISTGPYAYVRHPMYATGLLILAGTPLLLGSWLGLAPLVVVLPVLIWRLIDEEHLLEQRLPGYREYERSVRWRLVPHVY